MLMVRKEVIINVLTWGSVPQFPQIVMQIVLLYVDVVRITEVFTRGLKEFMVCKKCV